MFRWLELAAALLASAALGAAPQEGTAQCSVSAGEIFLGNEAIACRWQKRAGRWELASLANRSRSGHLEGGGMELFELVLADGSVVKAGDLAAGEPRREELAGGAAVAIDLSGAGLEARWSARLRDGAGYLQIGLELRPRAPLAAAELVLWNLATERARRTGLVDGTPVTAAGLFLAIESPFSKNTACEPGERPAVRIGSWSASKISPAYQPIEWPLAPPREGGGPVEIEFRYRGGAERLDIRWAALLAGSEEVDRDEHFGFAGTPSRDNLYRLRCPASRPPSPLRLSAMIRAGASRNDSRGELWLRELRPHLRASLPVRATIDPARPLRASALAGAFAPGQLRRGFLAYLERERARPYHPYLHYNSWYDISWPGAVTDEPRCLEALRAFGEQLVEPYGVQLDGFAIDDGWDDPRTLWDFHSGFPAGFEPLRAVAARYGVHLGVWLSPFGGYGRAKSKRLEYGRAQGYETNRNGFSLAGERYRKRFLAICRHMIRAYDVNYFKFDGVGAGNYASGPGEEFLADMRSLEELMLALRRERADLFINLTTGSWPSPFWLRSADTIWRSGADTGLRGEGPAHQRYITYRDSEIYRNLVLRSPLFPLNAIMNGGIVYARHGLSSRAGFDARGLAGDIRSYFGGGTALQELYISPARMQPGDWKLLARAASWARRNTAVLADTHWIGADPARGQPYGWASWSPRKAILALRNPAAAARTLRADPADLFELPAGAARTWKLRPAWADERTPSARELRAGVPFAIDLAPFEVLVLEALPDDH